MILPIIIAVTSILALLTVVLLVSSHGRNTNLDNLRARLHPIDAMAFRNLIDEREEQFLREQLSGTEFRSLHRERMLAAVEYVRGAAHNASILIRLGEAAKSDQDPNVVAAAIKLQESAYQLRLQAYQALPRFYMRMILPGLKTVPQSLAENCDRLSRQAIILGCLQVPDKGIAVH